MSEETPIPKHCRPFTCKICQREKTSMFHEAVTGKTVGRFCRECGYTLTRAAVVLRITSVRVVADLLARGRTELVIAGRAYEIVPTDHHAIEMTRHERAHFRERQSPVEREMLRHHVDESPCWGEWSKDDE